MQSVLNLQYILLQLHHCRYRYDSVDIAVKNASTKLLRAHYFIIHLYGNSRHTQLLVSENQQMSLVQLAFVWIEMFSCKGPGNFDASKVRRCNGSESRKLRDKERNPLWNNNCIYRYLLEYVIKVVTC